MLSKRQNRIVSILNSEMGPVTGKELGQALGVSDRTIRSDVDAINREYQCRLIQANRRSGYCLDRELMKGKDIESKEMIPQTAQQRCDYLIRELLLRNHEINLLDIQDRVFVSGYSIDNDLKKLRNIIRRYPGLKLVRSRNHVRLSGSEEDKRRLYKELLMQEMKDNFANVNAIAELWDKFDLLKLEGEFARLCQKYSYHVTELEYPLIMLYLGVSIERMMNHNYISREAEPGGVEIPREDREFQIAKELFGQISVIYHVKQSEEEIGGLARILREGNREAGPEREKAAEPDLGTLMEEIYEILKSNFDIDISQDEEFRQGISAHIGRLRKRQQVHTDGNSPDYYLQELKRKYPLVFEMAVLVAGHIQRDQGLILNELEISFLALYLGAACQRVTRSDHYRVVAIIPNSRTISRPCVDKVLLRFGNRMDMVEVYPFFEEKKVAQDKPDLILSTVPLKHHLDVPTVQISLFFNSEDESKVFQMLNRLDKKKYHKDFVSLMERIMKKELFHIRPSMSGRSEILSFLCDSLYEKGLCGEDFKENVFRREALSDTSFLYGFAVPHAMEPGTSKSCISIMILKEPVKWGAFQVNLVVLLSIRETDNQLLKVFFDWLCNIVTDNNKFQELIRSESYEEFMRHVTEEE